MILSVLMIVKLQVFLELFITIKFISKGLQLIKMINRVNILFSWLIIRMMKDTRVYLIKKNWE